MEVSDIFGNITFSESSTKVQREEFIERLQDSFEKFINEYDYDDILEDFDFNIY